MVNCELGIERRRCHGRFNGRLVRPGQSSDVVSSRPGAEDERVACQFPIPDSQLLHARLRAHLRQQAPDNRVSINSVRLRFEVHQHAVAQDR